MHSHELVETAAAIVLVIAGLVFVPASLWLYLHRAAPDSRRVAAQAGPVGISVDQTLILGAAALSFGAAAIHFAAVGPHLEEFAPYAYAFAILGVAQVVLGVGLVRGWPRTVELSIVVSLAVVAVWVVSRTVGLPFGPEPWHSEEIGIADIVASAFEIGLVALLAVRRLTARVPSSRLAPLRESAYALLVPVSGLIGLITLLAVAALMGSSDMQMHS